MDDDCWTDGRTAAHKKTMKMENKRVEMRDCWFGTRPIQGRTWRLSSKLVRDEKSMPPALVSFMSIKVLLFCGPSTRPEIYSIQYLFRFVSVALALRCVQTSPCFVPIDQVEIPALGAAWVLHIERERE